VHINFGGTAFIAMRLLYDWNKNGSSFARGRISLWFFPRRGKKVPVRGLLPKTGLEGNNTVMAKALNSKKMY
jgi:hypothetical protein